jgi:hypothetical protein
VGVEAGEIKVMTGWSAADAAIEEALENFVIGLIDAYT